MNPSYSSGPSDSGANPGIISSTPETPQDGGRTGGGFSGFSNFSLNNIPKKWLMIAGGVLVGLLILMVVVTGMSGKKEEKKPVPRNDEFYNYANYMLTGESSTDTNIGDYDDAKDYTAMTSFWAKDKDYFAKAKELLGAFYSKNIGDGDTGVGVLKGQIIYEDMLLGFLSSYIEIEDWTDEELLDLYIKNGAAKTKTAIEKNYKVLSATEYKAGQTYINAKMTAAKTLVDFYAAADSRKCITNGAVDKTCLKRNERTFASVSERYQTDNAAVDSSMINTTLNELMRTIFSMKDELGR